MTFGVLTLIVACGLAGPLLAGATRLAVPIVVGEIAAGVVIGRTGFGEINTGDPTIVFLADAGFAMLMFVVGTRLPLRDPGLRRALRGATIATVLSFAGWVVLAEAGASYMLQALVNLAGIGLLWGTAWALAQRNRGGSMTIMPSAFSNR